MTTPAFDYQRDYLNTWKYYDGVRDAEQMNRTPGGVLIPPTKQIKLLWLDYTKGQWIAAAGALMLSPTDRMARLWPEQFDDPIPDQWTLIRCDGKNYRVGRTNANEWGPRFIVSLGLAPNV